MNRLKIIQALQSSMGALAEGDKDDFKRILLEGNPFFLGITMIVSLLHSVFDMLAFKNDIGFWKNKKNVQGLSVRTISINCFCQVGPRLTFRIYLMTQLLQ